MCLFRLSSLIAAVWGGSRWLKSESDLPSERGHSQLHTDINLLILKSKQIHTIAKTKARQLFLCKYILQYLPFEGFLGVWSQKMTYHLKVDYMLKVIGIKQVLILIRVSSVLAVHKGSGVGSQLQTGDGPNHSAWFRWRSKPCSRFQAGR